MIKLVTGGCIIIGMCLIIVISGTTFAADQKAAGVKKAQIARGLYLVTVGGCNDCHTPKKMTANGPVPDEARLLSGHPADEKLPDVPSNVIGPDKWGVIANNNLTAWVGPWGTSFTSNLSPDSETGIGAWNEELFTRIIRTGKFMGSGRNILPPMPWNEFAKLTDGDLKAIFAYLKSLKSVKNQVPDPVTALPPQ